MSNHLRKGVSPIQLTPRQKQIIEIVKENTPITGEKIANKLNVRRATLRPDLAVLTMAGLLEARPRVGYFYSGKTPYMLIAEEIRHLKVEEIKSVPVVVSEDASVYDAIVALFTEDVGTLFIVSQDSYLRGAASRKDLLKVALGRGNLHEIPVQVVMTRLPNIITVAGDESVYEAASKLVAHEIDALPVVEVNADDEGKEELKVVGRFTKTTVTRIFVEMGEER